jgi:two-component sensor histidine kinase
LQSHCLDGPDCTISGPAVRLGQTSAELMGLAIHELVTNSIKFGALAQAGRLSIDWSIESEQMAFRWAEFGVAIAGSAPRPYGFGRQLIEDALPYQLGATTSFDLKPGGVVCKILIPLSAEIASSNV